MARMDVYTDIFMEMMVVSWMVLCTQEAWITDAGVVV